MAARITLELPARIRLVARCVMLAALATAVGADATTLVGRIAGEFETTATGGAVYGIPLQVGAGMNGLRPAVTLAYNSQAGDGLAGMGWTLAGLSRIARCPLTRALDGKVQGVRFGSQDRFCLDGQPLVLVAGSYGGAGAEYRTEVHGHERIFSFGRQGSGPAWFELHQPDGLVRRFGNDEDSRVEAAGSSEISAWAINEVEDRFQQRIGFAYAEDNARGEHYPAEIRWTYSATETPQQGRLRLGFNWQARPAQDVRDGFQWGMPWRSSVRLESIDYEADTGNGLQRVHRYVLTYASPGAGDYQRSRLVSVTQCGPTDCLAPTTFAWETRATERAAQASDGPPGDSAVPGDFNGDGALDLYAAVNGVWQVWPADPANGGFLPPIAVGHGGSTLNVALPMDYNGDGLMDLLASTADGFVGFLFQAPARNGDPFVATSLGELSPAAMEIQPLDVDGDMLDDLVYLRNGMAYLRRNLGGRLAAEQAAGIRAVASPYVALTDGLGFIEPADFDGDGRMDLLVTRSRDAAGSNYRWEAFLSTGSGFATDPIASFLTAAAPRRVLVADVNGDGLSDVLRNADGVWRPWISRGTATGSTPGLVAASCTLPASTAADAIATVVDYDADGRSDLLLEYSGYWRVYLSSNGCFDAQRFVEIRQPVRSGVSHVLSTDANGDGYADLLFALANGAGWMMSPYPATDAYGSGQRPNLVGRFTDGLGNFHAVSHQALTGWPGYQATGTAPTSTRLLRGGAVTVVGSYTANTGIASGSYSIHFGYGGALLDGQGRGFLGFTTVTASDPRSGLTTERRYQPQFPYTGRIGQVTVRSGNSTVSRYDAEWASAATTVPDVAKDVHFVHLAGDVREAYEIDAGGGYAGSLVRRVARILGWNHGHGAVASEQTTVSAPQQPGASYRVTRTVSFDESLRTSAGCLGFPARIDLVHEGGGGASESRSVQYAWQSPSCRLATRTDGPPASAAQQLQTSYTYDSAGRTSTVVTRDAAGLLAARQARHGYEPGGYQPSTESALISGEPDLTVAHQWNDALGQVTSRISPQGLATSWSYDEFGRVRSETRSPGSTQYSYSACGPCFVADARYVLREVRSDGYWSESYHDSFGRVVGRSSILGDGRISRQVVEYDSLGRVRRESAPFIDGSGGIYWTTYTYDALGRPRTIDQPVSEDLAQGASQAFGYAGLETTVLDAEGRATLLTSDADGRLVSVRDALNGTTAYAYTPAGQLSSITDAGLHRRELRYDERGLLVETNDPDAGQRRLGYNAFGELVSQADGRSPPSTVTWQYDQLGRVTRRTEPEGTTTWKYSATPGTSRGLLVQVTGPGSSSATGFQESYVYDSKSRPQKVLTSIDGSSYQTDYAYDGESKLRAMTYPATVGWRPRFLFGYAYGQLSAIAQDNAGYAPVYALMAMDARGRESEATLGYDDVRETNVYDAASGRLEAIRSGTPASPARYQDYQYEWDRAGNLLSRLDALTSPQRVERFSYDKLNRLTRVTLGGVTTLSMVYTADGNIRTKSDVGNFAYGTDGGPPHGVSAIGGGAEGILTFEYDANGNMTSRGGNSITWTSFNLPRQVATGGNYARFTYGPARNRIRQDLKAGGVEKTIHYVGPHFEVEIQGGTRRYRSNVFAHGRAVFSQVESSAGGIESYYVLHDHQGSVDRLLRAAGTGADMLAHSFDAWGKRRNGDWTADPAGSRYLDNHWTERGYTGHEHLDNVQLVHMNGRLEDPQLGRMLSPDPVMGSLASPQALNPYGYVANSPLSYSDPSGFFLSKLRKAFKRAIRHIGSTSRRVVRRWGRQIVAAVAAYYTAGFVSSWAYGVQASGLTTAGSLTAAYDSSMVLGGMAGGAVAGAIGGGDLRSTLTGAVSGGAMGGLGAHFGGTYSAGRVLAEASVSGAAAELQGGDFSQGFLVGGSLSSLTWASLEMREAMIEQSKLSLENSTGRSAGFRGDGFKLGGSRAPSSGSFLGGRQGGAGSFLGIDYKPGSFLDAVVETYAGPHDFLNSPIFYNEAGNNAARWRILEAVNAGNIVLATPFAAASVVPSYAYGAISD